MPKKPLDANKPRGPVTAYALFVRTCRDELRRKYPQLNVDYNVIAKKCSERWKVMNENEKKRFNDSVESQRKRYKEEMATYNQEQSIKQQQQSATSSILVQTPATQFLLDPPSLQQQQQQHTLIMPAPTGISSAMKKPTKKRERKPKDPLAPKKPLSAYFLFCADERAKVMGSQSGLSVSDVARELGARWKNISPELKQKYEQSASEKKLTFMAEMTAYKHQSSTGSSPPATPQTPSTPHDYQSTFSSSSSILHQQQQQHPQLEQLLLQQQHFDSFDANDISDPTAVFDILADENPMDDSDD